MYKTYTYIYLKYEIEKMVCVNWVGINKNNLIKLQFSKKIKIVIISPTTSVEILAPLYVTVTITFAMVGPVDNE